MDNDCGRHGLPTDGRRDDRLHVSDRQPITDRLAGKDRTFIKGQRYTLPSNREHLSHNGRASLKKLLKANKRLNTAYLLKESFGQLWSYQTEGWAQAFFELWK